MPVEVHPFTNNKWKNNLPVQGNEWHVSDNFFAYMPSVHVKSIFLGTFPAWEVVNQVTCNGNKEFFYGSRMNKFWPLLSYIIDMPCNTETDLFQILQHSNFGITDIIWRTERPGKLSGDSALNPSLFNNIIGLKEQFPNLKNIYVTSGGKSPITNSSSKSASKWLRQSLLDNTGYSVSGFTSKTYQREIIITTGNNPLTFNIYSLLSPSNYSNRSIQGVLNHNQELMHIIQQAPLLNDNNLFKLRVVQWAYLLSKNNFPVCPALQELLNNYNDVLAVKWI